MTGKRVPKGGRGTIPILNDRVLRAIGKPQDTEKGGQTIGKIETELRGGIVQDRQEIVLGETDPGEPNGTKKKTISTAEKTIGHPKENTMIEKIDPDLQKSKKRKRRTKRGNSAPISWKRVFAPKVKLASMNTPALSLLLITIGLQMARMVTSKLSKRKILIKMGRDKP